MGLETYSHSIINEKEEINDDAAFTHTAIDNAMKNAMCKRLRASGARLTEFAAGRTLISISLVIKSQST